MKQKFEEEEWKHKMDLVEKKLENIEEAIDEIRRIIV